MKKTDKRSTADAPRMADDLRGLNRLAVDGVTGIIDMVEAMHAAITHLPSAIGRPAPATTRGVTGFVYRRVRGVTRLVGSGLEASLSKLEPVLGHGNTSLQREAVLAAANGVLGDHLEVTGNPLAIGMVLRRDGQALALERKPLASRIPKANGKLLVLVHGLCMNDLQWKYNGYEHGAALESDLDYTPVYLHYNSGRHISTNGRDFSRMLEKLTTLWPVPLQEITLLCHSMGGLVARSALADGFENALGWSKLPVRIIFLGTPHHGAPLERAGSWADMLIGLSPYSAPLVRLGKIRSAGIQDLRHGNVRDSDWQARNPGSDSRADGRTPITLPTSVHAYAMAASSQEKKNGRGIDAMRGDGLVPVASALGRHPNRAFGLRIPQTRQWVGHGINHLDLLGSPAVYQQLLRWLRKPVS